MAAAPAVDPRETPGNGNTASDVFEVGSKLVQIQIKKAKKQTIQILATELDVKDAFQGVIKTDELKLGPNVSVDNGMQFLLTALFEPSSDLFAGGGFVDANFVAEDIHTLKDLKRTTNDNYENGNSLVIGIEMKSRWSSQLVIIKLDWVEREKIDKLEDVIRELRAEIRDLRMNQTATQPLVWKWTTTDTNNPFRWNKQILTPPNEQQNGMLELRNNNTQILIKKTGMYRIIARLTWNYNSNNYSYLRIYKPNGNSRDIYSYKSSANQYYHTSDMHEIAPMMEGAYFQCATSCGSIPGSNENYVSLTVEYMGDYTPAPGEA